jgi:undecaprenyl-diphosphatase
MPRDPRSIGDRLLVAALLLLLLAAVSYAAWDRSVANWAFHLPRPWANAARWLSSLGEGLYWLGLVTFIAAVALVRRRHAVAVWALKAGCAVIGAGLSANVLKMIAGRARPRALDDGVWGFHFFEVGYRFASFPSGHAAVAAAVAASICLARPDAWPFAALLWLALAGGRVMTGSHFVSDVFAAGALGIAVMVLVARWGGLDAVVRRLARDRRCPVAAAPDGLPGR